jgi:hypothetical protein
VYIDLISLKIVNSRHNFKHHLPNIYAWTEAFSR